MNWEMIMAGVAVIAFVGTILIYAAKSIFQTKEEAKVVVENINSIKKDVNSKLYDDKGATNFVLRTECEKHKEDLDRRKDASQRAICDKINDLKKDFQTSYKEIADSQSKLNSKVSNLTGRFEQYLDGEIKREDSKVDKLAKRIDGLITVLKKTE